MTSPSFTTVPTPPSAATALDPFYEARAARSSLPRADFAFFIQMHTAATILLDVWMARLAAMDKTAHTFDLFIESVTCLERLVSIEKTITHAPERITADDIAALALLVRNLELLSGHQLPLPPAPSASSDTKVAPASLPASPAAPAIDVPGDSVNTPSEPVSEPTAAQSPAATSSNAPAAAPAVKPQPTRPTPAVPSSPATPAVSEPALRAVRACPILRAPGAALLKVYVTLTRLTGRPAFELFKSEIPRAPLPPQATGAPNTHTPPSSTITSATTTSAHPGAYPSLCDIIAFFCSAFRLSPYAHAFSSG